MLTPEELEAQIKSFCVLLFDATVDVSSQEISAQPVIARVGIKHPTKSLEELETLLRDNKRFRACWLQQWPINMSGRRDPRSIDHSGDGERLLFDLVFFNLHR
jgi:hypothetical protein